MVILYGKSLHIVTDYLDNFLKMFLPFEKKPFFFSFLVLSEKSELVPEELPTSFASRDFDFSRRFSGGGRLGGRGELDTLFDSVI